MARSKVDGRYFTIENKATGMVLSVKDGLALPRSPVVMGKEHKGDNQVWYIDPLTDTIRSLHNHLCIDLDAAGRLIINPYEKDDPNQKWRYNDSKDVIENIVNSSKVLDVPGGSKSLGAEVFATELHGGNSQKWNLDGLPIKYFMIRSKLSDKVADILGGKSSPGSRVILWDLKIKNADSQLWFEDCYGNIRPKLNSKLTLDGSGHCVLTAEFKRETPRSYWVISGNRIVNKENHNEVLGVKDRLTMDGAELNAGYYRGETSQHWSFERI